MSEIKKVEVKPNKLFIDSIYKIFTARHLTF